MKNTSKWEGIAGGLLVIVFISGLFQALSKPTVLHWVNVATVASDVGWILLGAVMLLAFLKLRQQDDAAQNETSTSEEHIVKVLKYRRNRIMGYVLMFLCVGSTEAWVLNDYHAGPTMVNLEMVFDIILSASLLFFAYKFIKNNWTAGKEFLALFVLYCGVEAVFEYARLGFASAISVLPLIGYFAYAVLTPVTIKNNRILHFVILPGVFVIGFAILQFTTLTMDTLQKNETLLEQQYLSDVTTVANNYGVFLNKETPSQLDIQNILDAVAKRDTRTEDIIKNLNKIKAEFALQLPSVNREVSLHQLDKFVDMLNVETAQTEKIKEFMQSAKAVDFKKLTESEAAKLNAYKGVISDYEGKIVEAQTVLSDPQK